MYLCMCVCVCVYTYTDFHSFFSYICMHTILYKRTYIHTYIHAICNLGAVVHSTHVYIHMYIHTYLGAARTSHACMEQWCAPYIHIYVCNIHIHICNILTYIQSSRGLHTYLYTYMYTYIHTSPQPEHHMHAWSSGALHTYIHTYIHTYSRSPNITCIHGAVVGSTLEPMLVMELMVSIYACMRMCMHIY